MSECVFCRIIDGREPARIVYQDDAIVGFLDISPIARGHTLLVPRIHSTGLDDLDPEIGASLFAAGQRVAAGLKRSSLGADGVNLMLNDGRAAFQTVFHTHLHVVPRHSGDKLSFAKGFLTRRAVDPDGAAAALTAALPDHQ